MTAREILAVARLAVVAASGITTRVQEVHQAVAKRAFGLLVSGVGTPGEAIRELHDAVAATVYGEIRIGLRAGLVVADVAGTAIPGAAIDEAPVSLSDRPGFGTALALVNGWAGDRLHESGDILATRMAVRSGGRAVVLDREHLGRAFPAATGRVAVFLHGLVNTETDWQPRAEGARSFGDRLGEDLGVTPVYIRYNTGRHISQNGALLAELLEQLVAAWPIEVTDLILVGHSMGGLVARSALHQAAPAGALWPGLVRATVSLGSPHLGAPLERVVNELEHRLRTFPETTPFAKLLTERSSGIKDLRFGNLVEEDWHGHDPGHRRNQRILVQLAQTSPHFVVYATFTQRPDHPVAHAIGDLMVTPPSATGRGRRHPPWDLPAERTMHIGGLHHLQLLHHPQVYEQLRTWVESVL